MTNEDRALLLSQLADGELPQDQANEILLHALETPNERADLRQFLLLRQATAGARQLQPERPIVIVDRASRTSERGVLRSFGGLALAACIGGLAALVTVWALGWAAPGPQALVPAEAAYVAPRQVRSVTPEQMRQVASVFALHESVAGPLAWYAADDRTIRLASARGPGASQTPIAVLLTFEPTGSPAAARTLIIVCRDAAPAMVDLPAESPDHAGLRVTLSPRWVNGALEVQYAITLEGDGRQSLGASLSGRRDVGLVQTSLGQLALENKLLNIEASAWQVAQEHR